MKTTKSFRLMALAVAMMIAGGCFTGCNSAEASNPKTTTAGTTASTTAKAAETSSDKTYSEQYKSGDSYSIDNIVGKRMSFVSNSSTSGFKVPTNAIISHFSGDSKWSSLNADGLVEGGNDMFFSEVLFGGSHQGSAYNLMSGKSDISAFCNTEIAPYADCTSGTENETGSVYTIKSEAEAPFDTVTGKQFTVIQSTPVLNGPWAYNSETLSPEDAAAIQALFTSDEVANNDKMFIPSGSENVGMYKKTDKERFVMVDDSWYDPIRNLSK